MSTVPGPAPFRFSLRHEAITFGGVVERNWYLIKRYGWWELAFFFWSLANTLTIVFIAKGIKAAGGQIDVNRATTTLLIGAVIWSFLGLVFEFMTETVAWERWEGTIEYTFMAPLRRWEGVLDRPFPALPGHGLRHRSEEHTLNSSHVEISYAVFC